MQLLHISDLHFSSGSYNIEPHKVVDGLIELIQNKVSEYENFYLLVTGDITFKGQESGFQEATSFFEKILKSTRSIKNNFLVCPGNHDISNDKKFDAFDVFSYSIRLDNTFTFKDNYCNIFFDNDYCFLAINTAYHLIPEYGKIDLQSLATLLEENKDKIKISKTRIVFFHHHILNILDDDNSSIKNSYNFFHMIEQYGFHFIFHGHQHAKQLFDINQIKINSISSLLEKRTASNLVAFYKIDNNTIQEKEEYIFMKDEIKENGERGRYKKLC